MEAATLRSTNPRPRPPRCITPTRTMTLRRPQRLAMAARARGKTRLVAAVGPRADVAEEEGEWEWGGGVDVVALLEGLEREAIMGEDEGKDPMDYDRRARIFDKSSRVFMALKQLNDDDDDDSNHPQQCHS